MHPMILKDEDIAITFDPRLKIYRLEAFGEMVPICPRTLSKWAYDCEKRDEWNKAWKFARVALNDKLIFLGKIKVSS